MKNIVAILEDDPKRIEIMQKLIAEKHPTLRLFFNDNSADYNTWIKEHIDEVCLISLDHDLPIYRDQNNELIDHGSGREAADLIATLKPMTAKPPIIIHSTNVHAAIGMEMALQECGWHVTRITPYGEYEWIGELWWDTFDAQLRIS